MDTRVQNESRAGIGYALGAAALFGASTPAAKLLLGELSPLMLSALLYLGAAVALTAYRLSRRPSREAPLGRSDIPAMTGIVFFGGILGPLLMLFGLRRISAFTGALLLNLEGPFTALIAVGVFREHLGRREQLGTGAIMLGAMLVGLEPGYFGGSWMGALEVAAACLSWGIDNNLTQRISLRDPVAVGRIKTLAAGWCVLAMAMLYNGARIPRPAVLILAGGVGALCYGLSIVLDVKALRALGAAREAAYFATATFAGALLSLIVFGDLPGWSGLAGALLMVAGVLSLIRAQHDHLHEHERLFHEHLHIHDEHHQHPHERAAAQPHSHQHAHQRLRHAHPHASDLHHRHRHQP